ncbi:MAG: uncharacterized protein KVP18_003773 [Porospora cf. gigantea A]|uniref:uncharacterized protein n=1 Tax=Porospora cf. gigantea A TaxID=2853593 RepID=UPI0035597687|nr:MAG: hypothetical protein KVP18_003773 [Porospora cf. gigantea A]
MPRRKTKVSGRPQRRNAHREGRLYLSDLKDLLLNSDSFTQGDRVLVVAEGAPLEDHSRRITKNSVLEVHSHPSKLCNLEGDKQVDCEDRLDYRLVNAKGRPYGRECRILSELKQFTLGYRVDSAC